MLCRRQPVDDDIYCVERNRGSTCGGDSGGSISSSGGSNGRHFTITKTFHQPMVYDEVEKNVRLPSEADMIPSDRIYEIRKEKIMIKADRNTSLSPVPHQHAPLSHHMHPPSMRSKSSDRYIDVPKSVRIVDDYGRSLACGGAASVYDTDCEDTGSLNRQQRLKSRSGYAFNSDYETTSKSYLENYVETNTKLIGPGSNMDTSVLSSSLKRPPNCPSTNEIIYVPMVKEEFIKRESSKNMHCATNINLPPFDQPGTGFLFSSGSNHNINNTISNDRF